MRILGIRRSLVALESRGCWRGKRKMRAGYSALEKEDIQVELRDKFLIFLGPQLRKPSET
jgi:hypothetical protein